MPGIPRILIQTARTAELSLRQRAISANLRLMNPTFDHLFFDNQAVELFIDQHFPQHRETFDSFQYRIQRYDFFRYLAVYHYGGFYFDLDVLLAQPLTPLLDNACVFPFEGLTFSRLLRGRYGMDWQIGNYAFGAEPRHWLIGAIIDNVLRAQQDPAWSAEMMAGTPRLSRSEFVVLNTTGPGLISRTFAERSENAGSVTVLFPPDVCDVSSWNLFGDYGIHLMEGDWRPRVGWLRRRLAQRLEVRTMERLIEESRRAGRTRSNPAVPAPVGRGAGTASGS